MRIDPSVMAIKAGEQFRKSVAFIIPHGNRSPLDHSMRKCVRLFSKSWHRTKALGRCGGATL